MISKLLFALTLVGASSASMAATQFVDSAERGRVHTERCEATNSRGDIYKGQADGVDSAVVRQVACDRALDKCRLNSPVGARSCRVVR